MNRCGSRGWDRGFGPHPLKITKIKGFLAIHIRIHWKFTVTKPAVNVWPWTAHQRNAIKMAFRWRVHDGPFTYSGICILALINLKNVVKLDPLLWQNFLDLRIVNNIVADQTARMSRLVCTFVVLQQNQGFTRQSPCNTSSSESFLLTFTIRTKVSRYASWFQQGEKETSNWKSI